jgi:hypothetical protein
MAFTKGTSNIRIKNIDNIVVNYTELGGDPGTITNTGGQLEQGVSITTAPNSKFNSANGCEVTASEKCTINYTVLGNNLTDLNVYQWLKTYTTKVVTLEITLDDGTVITTTDCIINSTRVVKANDLFRVNVTIEKNIGDVDDFISWT